MSDNFGKIATAQLRDIVDGYNLTGGLKAFKTALADVDRNPVKIDVFGTSISYGSFASDLINTNYVSRIRNALQDKYGDVGQGNYFIPASATTLATAPWWSFTGTWVHGSGNGIGARTMYAGGTVSTATLTFTGTSIDLIFQKAANGSASGVTVTIDGAPQTPPDFSGTVTLSQVKNYAGLSAGSHTMVITADPTAGKYCYIEDAIVYNPTTSGQKGVYVHNFGRPSASSIDFSPIASRIIPVTAPHLVIFELGVNDTANPATFLTNMTTLISAAKASATTSVLLLSMYDWNVSQATLDAMKINRQHILNLAKTYDCAVADVYSKWGTYSVAQALSLWGTTGVYSGDPGSDTIHPSDRGHRFLANIVLDAIAA